MEGPRQDRIKGLWIIQELSMQLRVNKECMATANTYFQKYTTFCSSKFKTLHLSAACVFLAGKVVEQPRHIKSLCEKLYQVKMKKKVQKTPNLQVPPASFSTLSSLKDSVIFHEFLLLEEIGFNVSVKLPYNRIKKFVDNLSLPATAKNNFLRVAYGFGTDFFKTKASLYKSHHNIAENCLFLAARSLKFSFELVSDPETLQFLNLQ